MFFRWLNRFAAGALVLGVSLGCAGEKEPFFTAPNVKFDSPKFQCLVNVDTIMGQFIEGRLSDSDLQSFWNCLDLAVVEFVTFTRGRDGSRYTPSEIASFLDTYFLDNRGLVNETAFLSEMMEIKKVFIGGNATDVTHYDLFVRTRELIREFKAMSLELNPHMQVIYEALSHSDNKRSLEDKALVEAQEALHNLGSKLGRLIQDRQQFYSFSHLTALLNELEKLIRKTDPEFSLAGIVKYLPILSEVKGLLVSPPYDLIRSQDWGRLTQVVTRGLAWTMRYRYYIEDHEWDQGQPFEILESMIAEAFEEVDRALTSHPNHEFPLADLDRLMDRLEDVRLLPLDIDAAAAKETLRQLTEKILAPSRPNLNSGFNSADLQDLKKEVFRWVSAQKYLNDYLKFHAEPGATDGPAQEMYQVLRRDLPLVRDGQGRLIFGQGGPLEYDRPSLTALNWQRAIIRALMRGYSKNANDNSVAGLTLAQLKTLAVDWHALAEDLGLFDPGQGEAMAKKIFMEANLFLPSSNGDDLIGFHEATEYLAFALSGMNASDQIFAAAEKECADPNAPNLLLAPCARQTMLSQRAQVFAHVPQLNSFLGSDDKVWPEFEKLLESTVRDGGFSETSFKTGDLVEMMVLVQYVETFFAKYDKSQSLKIDVPETLAAYPVFRRSLGEIVESSFGFELSDSDLLALFTFLFKHGHPPQSTFGGMVKFLNWKWNRRNWEYDVDRLRVVEILAELNASR